MARDDAVEDSDVDLLVDMDPDRSLLDIVGLGQDLEALLDRKVDVVTGASLHAALRDRIRAAGLAVLLDLDLLLGAAFFFFGLRSTSSSSSTSSTTAPASSSTGSRSSAASCWRRNSRRFCGLPAMGVILRPGDGGCGRSGAGDGCRPGPG